MRKLSSKLLIVAAIVLFSGEATAAGSRPSSTVIGARERITARDGDRLDKVVAGLKRFFGLLISSNDMIPPIP
jgi:hypothetical protein